MTEEAAQVIDLVADDLALARIQIDSGLAPLAEGTLRRRIAHLEADGVHADDELDASRVLLAETLWRQQRLVAARIVLDAVRHSSPQRRLPIAMLIEAEALGAAGEPDRAAGLMERVIGAIGVDDAWALRAGVPSRLAWPLPSELRPEPRDAARRPPWSSGQDPVSDDASDGEPVDDERTAAARARLESARSAYAVGETDRGDAELSVGLRLDPTLAADGLRLVEPTLGAEPPTERLLLYGDLLRATGRPAEASAAYDRAADDRS